MTLENRYSPAEIEARWYAHWESEGLFRPARPGAEPFTIVIPPPNVTGSLHVGHALDNTLQDVLIRYHRLKGRDAMWVVGTDHAGIATQMVVERTIESQGLKRAEMGREAFLAHVWEWKARSGGTITRQLRRLGASCDWSNERFTMDPGMTAAVTKTFVTLYEQGLLYRDKRLVNWDPKFRTAISDLEVEQREVAGKFWYFRYPLSDDPTEHIVIATTRPETMLGDVAVAVHPKDDRYRKLIGRRIAHPITGRLIEVVADEWANPELGTGAVKITPAHDFNDYEVARRHGLPLVNIFTADARITVMGQRNLHVRKILREKGFDGVSREAARTLVVSEMERMGLLDRIEEKLIQIPHGDRSGAIIEPLLTDQWYVNAKELAKPALAAVSSGETRFVPESWEKVYFNWLKDIQPWCVSRQLWWGHRIPAYYGPKIRRGRLSYDEVNNDGRTNQIFVASDERHAVWQAKTFYAELGNSPQVHIAKNWEDFDDLHDRYGNVDGHVVLRQDEDVLDTWFSSGLWPFATLGWPECTEDLARHYPTDVLVTGFDIIFFWVARMMMQGIHFMDGQVPFRTVYCHGLVRDAKGQKMSKSRGNTVDPLVLIDQYGADALRFTMTAMETQGRDIKLNEKRVEGYRNFGTKLWNAARFAQANGIGASRHIGPPEATLPVNRWVIGEVAKTAQALDLAIAEFRFDAYAETIYQFVWSRFCDWYIELIKPSFAEDADPAAAAETRKVAGWALDQILVMLHPVMPFITEELWHAMGERPYDLIVAKWVAADAKAIDVEAAAEIDWLIELISEIRSARVAVNVPASARTNLFVVQEKKLHGGLVSDTPPEGLIDRFKRNAGVLHRMARIDIVQFANTGVSLDLLTGAQEHRADVDLPLAGRLQLIVQGTAYIILVGDLIDLAAESARLEKGAATAEKERDALKGRLASPGFVEKAKPEAVEKARADLAERSAEAERMRAALARLG